MIKKKKNLVRSPDEYTRYYGNFRGVDFSSDHTQVNERRFAYAVNMYKDYRSGEGSAIETIPGFRRRFEAPSYIENGIAKTPKINGIHEYENIGSDGKREQFVFVHAGDRLYRWKDYPLTANVKHQLSLVVPIGAFPNDNSTYEYDFNDPTYSGITIADVVGITINDTTYTNSIYYEYNKDTKNLTIKPAVLQHMSEGQVLNVNYYESVVAFEDALITDMADATSKSFVFNNDMYIIDGKGYYVFDNESETAKVVEGYIPTVYKGIPLDRDMFTKITDYEQEQKNLISDKFIHTFIADGATDNAMIWGEEKEGTSIPIYDVDVGGIDSIYVYDRKLDNSEYRYMFDSENKIYYLFIYEVIKTPNDMGYGEDYAGIVVTFKKISERIAEDANTINKCTICAEFDKRVFLSGNPLYPNNIWYSGLTPINDLDSVESANYFGELDVVVDGVENAPITGLIPVADTLAALKNHARQDGTVYFHSRLTTDSRTIPVTYPSERGLSGYGCLGACVNFLDDPIFISRLGVEAIGQLSVRLERAVEHRSTLIDSKLVNLDLSNAKLAEWDGYLIVLVDGRIFMADSRQVYQAENGNLQYEWYYLEGIGVYANQRREYYYAPEKPRGLPDKITLGGTEYEVVVGDSIFNTESELSENLINTAVKADYTENDGIPRVYTHKYIYEDDNYPEPTENTVSLVVRSVWDGKTYDNAIGLPITTKKAIVCEDRGSFTGGEFKPANVIVNMNDNLFFGTTNGIVCSFNFDQATPDGTLSASSYSFDNRTIYCGVATKMDNCDIPHLNKSTIKKSTVMKTKSMIASAAKIKIRTNKSGYKNIARLNSNVFSFEDVDFSDFSFESQDQTIFAVREKEKNWVEKQHWIYSDEYQRPFSIHYLAFRYKISGRIKE